jgi:hypothetical protein
VALVLMRDTAAKGRLTVLEPKAGLQALCAADQVFPLVVYGHYTSKGYAEVARQMYVPYRARPRRKV